MGEGGGGLIFYYMMYNRAKMGCKFFLKFYHLNRTDSINYQKKYLKIFKIDLFADSTGIFDKIIFLFFLWSLGRLVLNSKGRKIMKN